MYAMLLIYASSSFCILLSYQHDELTYYNMIP